MAMPNICDVDTNQRRIARIEPERQTGEVEYTAAPLEDLETSWPVSQTSHYEDLSRSSDRRR